jgi:hypothetical protein
MRSCEHQHWNKQRGDTMNLDSKKYVNQYLAAPPGTPAINDAVKYGVTIREAQAADGQLYWRVIGVHHLSGPENQGNHTILVEALNEQGGRLRRGKGPPLVLGGLPAYAQRPHRTGRTGGAG